MGGPRIGFLGAGLIATFHSKMLRASGEEFERAGVFDPDGDRAADFVRAARGGHVCGDEVEVLDSCDAVYVCTWTSEHPRLVEAAAERGLAIFCEKPLATTLEAARQMTRAVSDAGVANQVGLVLRRSPAFTLMRDIANGPASGRIMSVVFRDDQYIPVRGHYASTWRGEVDKVGAGTLLEHSIHDVDMLEWICGRVAEVNARSAEFHSLTGIEDVMNATLAFANGALGVMTSVWHDIDARGSLRHVEVFCERAYIEVTGDWFGPVRWTFADGTSGELEGNELVAKAEAIQQRSLNPDGAFVKAVREGTACDPDFAVALRAHEVTDALYRSAAEAGTPVALV